MNENECFSFQKFHEFVATHPSFFFPAIFLQTVLQTEIMGELYWKAAKQVRRELLHGKDYVRWTKLIDEVEVSVSQYGVLTLYNDSCSFALDRIHPSMWINQPI
jgi:hypothetical protein